MRSLNLTPTLRNFCIAQFGIVTIILSLAVAAKIVGYATGHFTMFGFLRLLDVGSEQSIPTFVSTVNLLVASALLLGIYQYERFNSGRCTRYWLFLSLVFFYLSIDESSGIHENFGKVYNYLIETGLAYPALRTHQWLPFGVLFVVVFILILLPFLRQIPRVTLRNFLIAGFVFVAGAIGFEYVGTILLQTGIASSRQDLAYVIRTLVEEGLEMYGIAIFNCALYREVLVRNISASLDLPRVNLP